MSDERSTEHKIFEAHITFDRMWADQVKILGVEVGWKFSQIYGDPVMGNRVFCYLTAYDRDPHSLLARMNKITAACGMPHERTKIERVVYDSKTKLDLISVVD